MKKIPYRKTGGDELKLKIKKNLNCILARNKLGISMKLQMDCNEFVEFIVISCKEENIALKTLNIVINFFVGKNNTPPPPFFRQIKGKMMPW